MVIGAHSTSTEIPTLFPANRLMVIQLDCENDLAVKQLSSVTAQLWKGIAVKQHCLRPPWGDPSLADCCALLCSAPPAPRLVGFALGQSPPLCSGNMSLVFQLQPGKAVFSFPREGKVLPLSQQGAGLFRQKSPPALTPDCSVLMQMGAPNTHSLIGRKALSWLVRMEALWLMKLLIGYSCTAPSGQGEPGSFRVPELLYGGRCSWQNHTADCSSGCRAGSVVQAALWSVVHMGGLCVEMAAGFCFLKFEPS